MVFVFLVHRNNTALTRITVTNCSLNANTNVRKLFKQKYIYPTPFRFDDLPGGVSHETGQAGHENVLRGRGTVIVRVD